MSATPSRPARVAPVVERASLRLVHDASGGSRSIRGRGDLVRTSSAILGLTAALCAVGTVMVLSASAYTSLVDYGSVWSIFERQVLWMVIGSLALFITWRTPYDRWRRIRYLLLFGTMALLLAVLVPGVGVSAGGASRWVGFGQLRLQPSELMKLAISVFAADLLTRRANQLDKPRAVVFPMLSLLAICAVLVLAQPDMGTALVLACIVFSVMYAGGVPLRAAVKAVLGVGAIALFIGLVEPYRRARLLSFLNPFAHAKGSGYQVVQSLVGLGSGRLYGLGLGAGREKWGLLPNAHTDFIFSVIGEETGLIGTLLVLFMFGALAWYGLRAASRAPDRFGGLLAIACTSWITMQALINIGAVVGLLPVTGIPLPFISFGGSSLVITMVAAGILANVAAYEVLPGEGATPAVGRFAALSAGARGGPLGRSKRRDKRR